MKTLMVVVLQKKLSSEKKPKPIVIDSDDEEKPLTIVTDDEDLDRRGEPTTIDSSDEDKPLQIVTDDEDLDRRGEPENEDEDTDASGPPMQPLIKKRQKLDLTFTALNEEADDDRNPHDLDYTGMYYN